jgi:hypothetical protein
MDVPRLVDLKTINPTGCVRQAERLQKGLYHLFCDGLRVAVAGLYHHPYILMSHSSLCLRHRNPGGSGRWQPESDQIPQRNRDAFAKAFSPGVPAHPARFFHMPGYYYLVHKPHVDFFVINSNTFNTDAVQQKWLDKQLAASTADWKIVMGHHPIYSSGEHGFNKELHETLEPILDKHHADLYLAGHDHDYERFQPIQGVQYIVAGGGGAYLRGFDKPMPKSLVRIKAHHFLSFQAAADDLKMQVIDKTGKQIDQAEWTKALSKPQKSRFLGSR